MRPELIENPTFLRYYEKWQKDPSSVVFAAISEIFRAHNMIDDAIKIAVQGLRHHPDLVSGHIALAKAYLAKEDQKQAIASAETALKLSPSNIDAKNILSGLGLTQSQANNIPVEEEITEEAPIEIMEDDEMALSAENLPSEHEAWHTVTMAKILETQGHFDRARKIYKSILEREPDNEAARHELTKF
jgi:tetratricopeptide (TPR) repeat protein